jgi:septum formation protein
MDILGFAYEIRPSRIDEKAIREDDPKRLATLLAEAKARTIADGIDDAIIVAGDAVVSKNGRIYEKPADRAEAREFLREFSGNTVEFVTAGAVMNAASGRLLSTVHGSKIVFRTLLDSEIADYVQRYDVLKFAGAFDGDGVIRFADHVSGSYNFATGVALNELISLLRQQGVEI